MGYSHLEGRQFDSVHKRFGSLQSTYTWLRQPIRSLNPIHLWLGPSRKNLLRQRSSGLRPSPPERLEFPLRGATVLLLISLTELVLSICFPSQKSIVNKARYRPVRILSVYEVAVIVCWVCFAGSCRSREAAKVDAIWYVQGPSNDTPL